MKLLTTIAILASIYLICVGRFDGILLLCVTVIFVYLFRWATNKYPNEPFE